MKFTSGTYIVIAFGLFIAFILTLVIKTYQFKVDMVSEDYYGQELKYQQKIDKMNLATANSQAIEVKQYDEFLELNFPVQATEVTGIIEFYRPSDSSKDINLAILPTTEGKQQIRKKMFLNGLYKMKIDWQSNGAEYYTEQDIYIQK